MHHVSIDFEEGDADGYRGVVVRRDGRELHRWASGDPQADWASLRAWAAETGAAWIGSSSIDHFLQDVPGWRMIEDAAGREWLVPEDRPAILASEAAARAAAAEGLEGEIWIVEAKAVDEDADRDRRIVGRYRIHLGDGRHGAEDAIAAFRAMVPILRPEAFEVQAMPAAPGEKRDLRDLGTFDPAGASSPPDPSC